MYQSHSSCNLGNRFTRACLTFYLSVFLSLSIVAVNAVLLFKEDVDLGLKGIALGTLTGVLNFWSTPPKPTEDAASDDDLIPIGDRVKYEMELKRKYKDKYKNKFNVRKDEIKSDAVRSMSMSDFELTKRDTQQTQRTNRILAEVSSSDSVKTVADNVSHGPTVPHLQLRPLRGMELSTSGSSPKQEYD